MFSPHKAGILTNCELKIIEEAKKLVDEMKNLYKCNFNGTNSKKANKTIENFKENSPSSNSPIFCESCGGSSSRLSYHTSRQRWSRGHKARGQGHKKKNEAKDSLSEDRHSRGQGQECSRPRTKDTTASAL